jgi:predicted protein tyrosine phosphatase
MRKLHFSIGSQLWRDEPVPTIHVCPLQDLDAEIVRLRPSALMTLLAPDGAVVATPAGLAADTHLTRLFHDIVEERPPYLPPSIEDVRAIIAFARRWDRTAPLLVHCYAGISRSTAAAFIMACALYPDQNEQGLAQRLRAASPSATPNIRMITFADDILTREGRMVRAIAGIGRGMTAAHGNPFVLSI